ncbi:MlaD family protein [Nocardia sp. NPDC057353]|uniref:MlaD family protein n=1 Tax=Nocardia sp. NPDC057353 TaxID=3346104 RepID=UPI00363AC5C4
MPAYSLSGTEVGPRRARTIGLCTVALAAVLLLAWRVVPEGRPADEIRVELVTGAVGAGVEPGTDVRLDGVRVGSVRAIDTAGPGRKTVELALSGSRLFGLTDALSVEYAPDNLFGITALQLRANPGGTALADGTTVDLTGPEASRVRDATLAALLKSTGLLTDSVLTPELAELLGTLSRDVGAFTPLLQAIGATVRAYVETRELPPSVLLAQFGSALAGVPPMITGGLDVLDAAYSNQYFRTPENLARFKEMFGGIDTRLLPVVTQTFTTARPHFEGLLPIATTVLDQIPRTVGDPDRTGAQLTELLDRLARAFRETPDGPVLTAEVELDVVPGLAGPLAAIVAGR